MMRQSSTMSTALAAESQQIRHQDLVSGYTAPARIVQSAEALACVPVSVFSLMVLVKPGDHAPPIANPSPACLTMPAALLLTTVSVACPGRSLHVGPPAARLGRSSAACLR